MSDATGPPPEDRGGSDLEMAAEWGFSSRSEHRAPATLAVIVAVALQLLLPDRVIVGMGPRWLFPALELLLALALLVSTPRRAHDEPRYLRYGAVGLIALINVANLVSLVELIRALVSPVASIANGRALVAASLSIWVTNVIVFALWYWELDRGGPGARMHTVHQEPDFLFPQMTARGATRGRWSPDFFDYLYTSYTNASAFSPTDTMPLTTWAKLLMMGQSFASLITVALVVSRAVNIL